MVLGKMLISLHCADGSEDSASQRDTEEQADRKKFQAYTHERNIFLRTIACAERIFWQIVRTIASSPKPLDESSLV